MKRNRRSLEIFSLSLLDVVSCAFGAVILLVLISKDAPTPPPKIDAGVVNFLLAQVISAESQIEDLARHLVREEDDRRSKEAVLRGLSEIAENIVQRFGVARSEHAQLEDDVKGLELVRSSLSRTSISTSSTKIRDDEVGGIPVDSDYVVFIVDTSGSMKQIWSRVTTEVENVIKIHPKIKGFQILNDNGAHIISGYEGKWIPDTPKRRESIINLFRSWNSASNSSPVEGLEVALRRYAKPNISVSVYIFGDEYSGNSYDPVINALVRLNTNRVTGKSLAKIHAVGFISEHSTGRFATLMREVTRRNGGTFLALPL